MLSSHLICTALFALPAILAFRDSSPLLIWSSESYVVLAILSRLTFTLMFRSDDLKDAAREITSGVIPADEIYATMASLGCNWETMVVAHVEDFHQSRLSLLQLPSSPPDLHIPYLLRPSRESFDGAVDDWAKVCGAEIVDNVEAVPNGRAVLRVDAKSEGDVFGTVSHLPSPQLLILTGSSSLSKRQEAPLPAQTSSLPHSRPTGINTTLPTNGPLLDRVQLLTTPIITGVLVTFGLFIPILYLGIYALVGIQVPPRMLEIGKSMSVGRDRKDQ